MSRSRSSTARRTNCAPTSRASDPVSKRPFMQEIIEALTRPLDEEDLKGVTFERSTPRLLAPDTEDNLQQLFIDNYWTDFCPIILPTEERVAAMLKGTSHPPDKVVAKLRPTSFREFWEITVEKVAVNAVMAGCQAGISAGRPGAGRKRHHRALVSSTTSLADDLDGERADPQ